MDNKNDLTGARICAIMYQTENCKDPNMKMWSINLPQQINSKPNILQNKANANLIKVMHLTDIHYDPLYLPGGNADCYEKEICCQRESTLKENSTHVPAGHWGDYHQCDIPWHTIQSAFDDIKKRNVSIRLIKTNYGSSKAHCWTVCPFTVFRKTSSYKTSEKLDSCYL